MALYLNQIFYKCNKFDNIDSLHKLEPFMLNNINYEKSVKSFAKIEQSVVFSPPPAPQTLQDNEIKKRKEPIMAIPLPLPPESPQVLPNIKTEKKEIFYPNREDSLFWCMFIAFYGYNDYEYIGKKYANKELEEKQKIMEHIKKTPKIIKETNKKITNVMIQEILSELLIQKETTLTAFIAFVFYYKKKVIIQNDNLFLFYSYNKDGLDTSLLTDEMDLGGFVEPDAEKTRQTAPVNLRSLDEYVILNYNQENNQYGIYEECTKEKIMDIINNKYCIDNIMKPIKGISCYKVVELEEIANKLNINTVCKKADLYNEICDNCKWIKENKIMKK